MADTTNTLGYSVFSGIENNAYLQEIYDALLHNDCLRLFHIDYIAEAAFDEVSRSGLHQSRMRV